MIYNRPEIYYERDIIIIIVVIIIVVVVVVVVVYSLRAFLPQLMLMVFHWNLSDSKSPQVSRTLLIILADLNNAIIKMLSTPPLTYKSSSPFINPLMTVPKVQMTIGIIITFMFHNSFQFPTKVQVLILLFIFFQFYSVVSQDSKVHNFASSFFLDYYKVWSSGRD